MITILKRLVVSTLLLFLLLSGVCYGGAEGINVTFNNTTNSKIIAVLYWVDHPYMRQTMGLPISVAGCEMAPGKKWKLEGTEPYGEYFVRVLEGARSVGHYENIKTFKFDIDEHDNIKGIEITPKGIKYERNE